MKKTRRHNNKGQFVIESILLMVVGISVLLFMTKTIREGEWMKKLVSEPWGKLAGMIESGVWETPKDAQLKHPNQKARVNSVRPED